MVDDNTFTATLYNENGEAADFESFTCLKDAIDCARDNDWDEVVDDDTGEIMWNKNVSIIPELDDVTIRVNRESFFNLSGERMDGEDCYRQTVVDAVYDDTKSPLASLTISELYNSEDIDELIELADNHSAGLYTAVEMLNLNDDDFQISNPKLHSQLKDMFECGINFFYIDNVKVDARCRNQGLGTSFVSMLPTLIDDIGLGEGIVLLCAKPVEIKDSESIEFKEAEEKLFRFYERCGFTRIGENVFLMLVGCICSFDKDKHSKEYYDPDIYGPGPDDNDDDFDEFENYTNDTRENKLYLPFFVFINGNDLSRDWIDLCEDDRFDLISDYLTNKYGFCHRGFQCEFDGEYIRVCNIKWDITE